MDTVQNGYLVLEYMRAIVPNAGDHCTSNDLLAFAKSKGIELDNTVDAVIDATLRGWITIADGIVHLTKAGYVVMNPAKDNAGSDQQGC